MLFKSFATLATLAFGVVSTLAAPSVDNSLVERTDPPGLAQIFNDTTAALTPITQNFQAVAKANLTIEALTPIANEFKKVLNNSITQVQYLNGFPEEVILATFPGGPLVTLAELAQIVYDLLYLSLNSIWFVWQLAYAYEIKEILNLLLDIGNLLGLLIQALFLLTNPFWNGGLVGAIRQLLGGLVTIIETIVLQLLIDLFHL